MATARYGQSVAGSHVRTVLRNGGPIGSSRPGGGGGTGADDLERRAKLYGQVPPPRPPATRMTKEERAALIPRILELREQGLTQAMIAKEMGVKTSQVERGYREWLKTQEEKR